MSSNANFVKGPDGKTVKKTVLPSANPSVGNVTAIGKVQIDLNNIVVGGETLSIEPESITFLNSTPGIATANKAVVLDDNLNIEQLNVVSTDELYVGGNQVTGLVNKGATVSNSIYMNDIQPGIGREGKVISSNDNGEVENVDIAAEIVEYNGGVLDSDSNEIFATPSSSSTAATTSNVSYEQYSHLKLKEIKNFYLLRTFNKVCYDSFRDINFATYIDTATIDIFESVFKASGGTFSKSITYASATGLTFTKQNIAYSPALDKYLIPVTTASQYSITLSPAGHPSTWTNSSTWTSVTICTFTNQNTLMPYIKWSSLLNKFLTSAGGKVYQSNIGETWTELYTLSNATSTRTIVCHDNYVMIANPADTAILYTTDGTTWLTKTFATAFCVSTNALVQYIPEVDLIIAEGNKITASTFLSRPATGNTFNAVYTNFSISNAKYQVSYLKDTNEKEFLIHCNVNGSLGNKYNIYSLERSSFIASGDGHWFKNQIIVFSYIITSQFTSTIAVVYDFSEESIYRGVNNIAKKTAKKNVMVEPEVFLNFEVSTRVIVRDFQWVPDIKKYIAIGFANEAYATSEYANVCLYHSDDLITFKFIRDLGRPNTNKIVVEETTGYVYGIEIGVNHLIILSDYGNTLISSTTTIGVVRNAVYDRYNSFGVMMTGGGPAVMAMGKIIIQSNLNGYGTGYLYLPYSLLYCTNGTNSIWPVAFKDLLYIQTAQSGNGSIANPTVITYLSGVRNFKQSLVPGLNFLSFSTATYSVPIYIEQLGIYVRLRYNFNNDATFKLSYTHQTNLNIETDPIWIEVPLQAPFFSYNSIWVPSLRYDSNSGRLYVVGNSDLQRTVISLNNLSLEETPFMRNHLSAHYARDDSGNELYPLQTIYTPAVNFNSIAYSCGTYAAVGLNTIFAGSKLSTATSSALSGDWKGIASSLTHFIVAGSGKIAVSTTTQPLSFQTNSTFPLVENWNYIHYSTQLDMWAVCADGKWAFSTDTASWTALDVVGNWKSIKYSNGHWIAVGLNNVGYLKMVTPAAPSAATVTEVVGDWRDSDFGGRWVITGFGKTAFSSGLNKPDGWTTFLLANGKNYNTATWVEGLSHFFLAGEHYSTFISNGNKLYHAPAQLTSEVSGKVCKFAMWSERYKAVIMVGDGCIMGTRMLGSGLDNSMIINSSIISSSNNPYNSTSYLKVSDYSESNFVADGYLSAVTNVTDKEILSIKNNSTGETVTAKQDSNLMSSLSVPKALALEATILKINDVRVSDELDLGGLGIGSEGVANSGNYLSLDSNGSISNLAHVNCGGLIVDDEMYSSSTPSQLTGVASGIVSASKAVKMNNNVSVAGVNDLASNGITIGGQEFVGESSDESLIKWSVGTNSSMDGGNFNITDTCYSTTLDLFVATTSFNNNTNMNAEREKNFILVSKDGINWRKVYTGLNSGLMYAIPAEKMASSVRTGIYFVTYASSSVETSYIAYTSDCVNFYWMNSQDYSGGSTMNIGYGTRMIFNDSVVNSPVVFKDPAGSTLSLYVMNANSGGSASGLKIANVKNAILLGGTQYYGLAGNNAVNAPSGIDTTPTSASIGTGTINNCIFIQGLSGTGVNWDVVYVADSGRVLFKTASEATLALTTMQPNTTLVVDATCNFTCITYNPVSRRMLITATNGRMYISDAGSKSIWTQVAVPNASVFDMEWTRVRCAYEKGFLLIHANDTDSKCNSKVCRVTNEGVFLETYTNMKRQLRLGAYGKGMYVVPILNEYTLGYKIMYSTDGIIWKYSLMQTRGVYRVIYVASLDKFFACYDKYIVSSSDAITWTTIFTHPINGVVCMELEYAENKNTLLGLFNATATQQLAYSTDTSNWNTSTIISNDNINYQFMKYCEQLSRLIVCTYESNGTAAMYSDNFTTFAACVSVDSEATNKPRGRNIMWVKEGSFLTMGNLWDGQWSSSDGISWTRNKVFIEYGSNGAYSFGTFNVMNNIYVPGYGDIIVHSNGSKGNNFVRISKGAYKVIAPAESSSVEWVYSMLMYNSDKNQIVTYKQSEGVRKGDTFLTLDLEDFRNNKIEIPVDYLSKISNDKAGVSSYLSTNNIVTLANSTLDGGALNSSVANIIKSVMINYNNSVDSYAVSNIFWIEELELFYVSTNTGLMSSKDGISWDVSLPNFIATSMCYSINLSLLVAVKSSGTGGRIAVSSDGMAWTVIVSVNDLMSWNKIVWASGINMFVACSSSTGVIAGDNNKIMTSNDGYAWVSRSTNNSSLGFVSLDYSSKQGMFLGITNSTSYSFVSFDGINWIVRTLPSAYIDTFKDIIWAPTYNSFVFITGRSTFGTVYATVDGFNLTTLFSASSNFDGIVWNKQHETYAISSKDSFNRMFVFRNKRNSQAIISDGVSFSVGSSKITWSSKFNSYFAIYQSNADCIKRYIDYKSSCTHFLDRINEPAWTDVCWSPELNLFVAVAKTGSEKIMISSDGSEWRRTNYEDIGTDFRSICWSSELNLFVAVSRTGIKKVLTSSNGLDWIERNTPGELNTVPSSWNKVCWSPVLDLFVAVSDVGNHRIMTSNNGIDWAVPNSVSSNARINTMAFIDVCWSSDLSMFIAISSTQISGVMNIAKSKDGIKWYISYSPIASQKTICSSSELGLVVIAGTTGICISSNGEYWKTITVPGIFPSTTISKLIWNGFKFVLSGYIGTNGVIYESKNGLVWELSYSLTTVTTFTSLAYAPSLNVYVAVSDTGSDRLCYIINSSYETTNESLPDYKMGISSVNAYTPSITTSNWKDIISIPNTSTLIACADNGSTNQKIMMSTNLGVSWTTQTSASDGTWSRLAYGSFSTSYKVYVSNTGSTGSAFILSGSGSSWANTTTGGNIQDIASSEELSIVVGVRNSGVNRIYTTVDGSFSAIPSADDTINWKCICWSPPLMRFVVFSNDNSGKFMTSANGINWTIGDMPADMKNSSWTRICWSDKFNSFLAVASNTSNNVAKSINGVDWDIISNVNNTFSGGIRNVIWCPGGDMFLAITETGNEKIIYSRNMTDWFFFSATFPASEWRGLCWVSNSNSAVFVSDSNPSRVMSISFGTTPIVQYKKEMLLNSTDETLASWSNVYWFPEKNKFIAIATSGNARIATSSNGSNWTYPSSDSYVALNTWKSLTYSPSLDLFIGVSSSGTRRIMYSSANSFGTTGSTETDSRAWECVCWSPSLAKFVAVASSGTSRIMSSSNGGGWTLSTPPGDTTNSWKTICWSPDLSIFVALANTGTNRIIRSSNGTTWVTSTSPANSDSTAWSSVCWSPQLQRFVAVSSSGTTSMISSDGIYWQNNTGGINTNCVSWAPEIRLFIAVGGAGNDRMMVSPDGIQWKTMSAGDNLSDWSSTCWNPNLNKIVSVASSGTNRLSTIIVDRNNITPVYPNFKSVPSFTPPRESYTENITIYKENLYTNTIVTTLSNASDPNIYGHRKEISRITYAEYSGRVIALVSTNDTTGTYYYPLYEVSGNYTYGHRNYYTGYFNAICELSSGSFFLAKAGGGLYSAGALSNNYGDNIYNTVIMPTNYVIYDMCNSHSLAVVILVGNGYVFRYNKTSGVFTQVNTGVFNRVARNNTLNLFVAVGGSGTITSSDGITWSSLNTSVSGIKPICVDNKIIVIGSSSVYVTTNGTDWSQYTPPLTSNTIKDIEYLTNLSLFIITTTTTTAYFSRDGTAWQPFTMNSSDTGAGFITYTGGYCYSYVNNRTGNYTMGVVSFSGSFDQYFTTVSSLETAAWSSICRSEEKDLFVSVASSGTSKLMTSKSGVLWNTYDMYTGDNSSWTSVTYCENIGIFIAVASSGDNRIMTSENGITWSAPALPVIQPWISVACSNNLIVAISSSGTNRIITSTNGIDWNLSTSTLTGLLGVIWSSDFNTFIGYSTTLLYKSTDGASWNNIYMSPTISNYSIDSIASGAGRILISITNATISQMLFTTNLSNVYAAAANIVGSTTVLAPVSSMTWNTSLNCFVAVNKTITGFRTYVSSSGLDKWRAIGSTSSNDWVSICSSYKYKKSVAVSQSGTGRVMNYFSRDSLYIEEQFSADESISYNSICHSDTLNLYVAVSAAGAVATSTNAIKWTLRPFVNQNSIWSSVCWSKELSMFVAISQSATNNCAYSYDGISWTAISVSSATWRSVCWAKQLNMFVAVGDTDAIMTSADGISWARLSITATGNSWSSVCYSEKLSLIVAVSNGSSTRRVITSGDGINWTTRISAGETNTWRSVCWSPLLEIFVAVASAGTSRVMTSKDGITWSAFSSIVESNAWNCVCWSDTLQMFVAVSTSGTSRIMASFTGSSWFSYTSSNETNSWTACCAHPSINAIVCTSVDGSKRVMTLRTSYIERYDETFDVVSKDITLIPNINTSTVWSGVCWSGELGMFVACASSGSTSRLRISNDGLSWTNILNSNLLVNTWHSVCWSPLLKMFVLLGRGSSKNIGISYDGRRWDFYSTQSPSSSWSEVIWCSELNIFIAVSHSTFATSVDGIVWSSVSGPNTTATWGSICWSPALQLFICVANGGSGNRIGISRNGVSWTSNSTATSNAIVSVVWSQYLSLFVAVCSSGSGKIITSSDGITWTSRNTTVESSTFSDLVWAEELLAFIAITSNGQVVQSFDGLNWKVKDNILGQSLASLTWSPLLNKFSAVPATGISSFILISAIQSPVVTQPASLVSYNYGTITSNLKFENTLIDIAYSNTLDIYVAFSNSTRRVWYSYDGLVLYNNSISTSMNNITWSKVIWNSSWELFVAIASGGTSVDRIFTSSDGKNWISVQPTGYNKSWISISSLDSDGGIVIALSSAGDVLRSTNGVDWTVTSSGNTNSWSDICRDSSKFIAISTSASNKIMTSIDGITWTTSNTLALTNCVSIAWGPVDGGTYLAVSGTESSTSIYKSINGIAWTAVTLSTEMTSVACGLVRWVSSLEVFILCQKSSNGSIYVSKNGVDWITNKITSTSSASITSVLWNSYTNSFSVISNAAGGLSKLTMSQIPTLSLPYKVKWDLLWVKGVQMFVAMKKINPVTNYTQFYVSTDGKAWSPDTTNFASHIAADALRSITSYTEIPQWDMLVTCKNSNYLQTISQNGVQQLSLSNPINCVYYSSVLKCLIAGVYNSNTIGLINLFRDGTLGNSIFNQLPTNLIIREICICNGNHIIISSGTVVSSYYYSYDMAKFETSTLPFADEWHFASRKVRGYELEVVAVSAGGIIIRSVDGISWTTVKNYNVLESAGSRKFSNIKYIEELEVWVAVDEAKKINSCIYSSDGINWIDVNMPSAVSLCDVAFSSSVDGFVFLTLPDDASQPVTTLATLPKVATCYNSMKVDGFNISSNGGIYTGNTVSNTFLSNTLETMPLLALATDSAYKPSTSTWTINSDRRLKEEIENMDVDECLNMLERLELKYYKWRDEFADAVGVEDKHKLGFIAQEVEEVVPDAIYNLGDIHGVQNAKSVNYDQLIAILYGAIQALMSRYEKLKTELES